MITTEAVRPSAPPAPPSREVIAQAAVPAVPMFRFQFQKHYGGLYTNRHDRFVLRDEHIVELKRLVKEHNSERGPRTEPLSMSDIVNAALDLALEHPLAFHGGANPDHLRDALGREVYRNAFLHFIRHEML